MPKYGVTGATGRLGPLAITQMLELGIAPDDIVAITRTLAKAASLLDAEVTVRYGDYSKPETLSGALNGVESLLLISGSEVGNRVAEHTHVVDAAAAAGVGHLVYTSVLRADTTPLPVAPEHKATEQVIRQSRLPFTFMRNSFYTENYTDQIPYYLIRGEIVGSSDGGRISGASRADYAAACVTALTQDGHQNSVYELGGTAFTMDDVAEAVSRATGTPIAYRNVPAVELKALLIAGGADEGFASFVLEVEEGTAGGGAYTDRDDLARLIGRDSTPLAQVVAAAA